MKKEIYLEGLDCASCAQKIEDQVSVLPKVKNVSLDFMAKKMVYEIEDEATEKEIHRLIQEIEPEVTIEVIRKKEMKEGQKELIHLSIGIVLFIVSLLIEEGALIGIISGAVGYMILGYSVLKKAGKNILRGKLFDENFLMSLATLGAWFLGDYREALAVMVFYQVGEYFQERAIRSSRKSIASLMDIRPDVATLLHPDGKEEVVSAESIAVEDVIIVKPGERIPLDGIIIKGKSNLDTSSLTGESLEREVEEGDEVMSGCLNREGLLHLRVLRVLQESTVSKILELVENTSSQKAKSEKFITKFSKWYTPVVVTIAALLAIGLPLVSDVTWMESIRRALTFLVISCPCALVVSIPLGFFAGIGGLSKNGILVKGSTVIDSLAKVDQVVLDKTGTITQGQFGVEKVIGNEETLQLAALAESYSTHPIAQSIVSAYQKEVDTSKITEHEELAGFGLRVVVEGSEIFVGNKKLMEKNQFETPTIEEIGTLVYVVKDKIYQGVLVISDQIKATVIEDIKKLHKINIKAVTMVTGDRKAVADHVANQVGIDQVFSECLPTDKVDVVKEIKKQGVVAFAGDGINDAPVLVLADVGIAMGGVGSDAAIEAADMVIMDDQLGKIEKAIKRAKKTLGIIQQNIVGAIGVKLLVLLLGAFGFVSMWLAIFADVGVSILAILNSIRLLKK